MRYDKLTILNVEIYLEETGCTPQEQMYQYENCSAEIYHNTRRERRVEGDVGTATLHCKLGKHQLIQTEHHCKVQM